MLLLFFRILFSDEEHLCNAPLTMVSDFLRPSSPSAGRGRETLLLLGQLSIDDFLKSLRGLGAVE
jgi:hypothetical protein